jgi:predicted PurR-regulated permease PerM
VERRAVLSPRAGDAGVRAARVEVVVSAATVVKAAALAVGAYVVIVAGEVVLSLGVASVLALGLDPVVARLSRGRVGRGAAALIVFAVVLAVVSALVIWVAAPLWAETRTLVADVPRYLEKLEHEPVLEQLAHRTGGADEAQALARDAAAQIPRAASTLLGALGAVVSSALSVVTVAVLTLFLLVALPDLRRAGLALLPPADAARVERVLAQVTRTISAALLGNVAISLIAAAVVGIAAVVVDAPYPVVLAAIVGLCDLVPQVGSLLAAAIVALIALAGTGVAAALALLLVIIVYQQVENYVIQPLVYRGAADLSGFATIAAVMAGGALMGVLGAILAVPVAASLKVSVRELTSARRRRIAAMAPDPTVWR